MTTKLFNKEKYKQTRRFLRGRMSQAEAFMWSKLSRRQLGYKFRRQYGVGPYITDFCSPRLKLIIEIDGGSHYWEGEKQKDDNREQYLKKAGFTIIRYTNFDVLENIDNVLEDILETCRAIEKLKQSNLTTPSPPWQGGEDDDVQTGQFLPRPRKKIRATK